jgi:hypothetical protein
MEQNRKKSKRYQLQGSLCDLPRDVIKEIIKLCPNRHWFTLCKLLHLLALQVISPLDYKNYYGGALLWSGKYYKLIDLRIDQ